MTCLELSILVSFYHGVRKTPSAPPIDLVIDGAPAEHAQAIELAFLIPKAWYKGKTEVVIQEACENKTLKNTSTLSD